MIFEGIRNKSLGDAQNGSISPEKNLLRQSNREKKLMTLTEIKIK